MFKTLKRNLKLGLTTLAILTAGAGAAFAQPAGFDTAIDPIAACSSDGFRKPRYCTAPVLSCITNPFGTNCATTLGTKAHTVAKVRYCGDQTVPSDEAAVSRHACSDTWAGTNAANWAKQKPDARTRPIARRNQFLKGTADGVDNGSFNIRRGSGNHRGALYFDTATFDGKPLGGDATDGVAFFLDEPGYFYTGILSGTDLGAPIMKTSGTASWVGRFQSLYYETSKDFVLEVTFGADGGSIEAFVHRESTDRSYEYASHFHLEGDFDDSGLITGTVDVGKFTGNDRKSPTGTTRYAGVLTGLIGQEGAVGAFHSNDSWYGGGFVAQPLAVGDTFFDDTCVGDPFTNKHQEFCNLEFAEERVTIINDCIIGSNASNVAKCGTAIAAHSCIRNPFASNCKDDFADYYETARTNRINFCINNPTNSFCTDSDMVAGICTYAPFSSACFNGDTYKSARAGKIGFCHANTTDLSCTGVTDNPNAVAWEYHLANRDDDPIILTDEPSTTNRRNQFLKGTTSGLNRGDIVVYAGTWANKNLNLSKTTFNNRALGGDASDGVAAIAGRVNNTGTRYSYAGIFSGTDLGAPVTDLSGTASWVGKIDAINFQGSRDFVLEIDFDGTDDKAGYVRAFVHRSGTAHIYLDGSYNAHGVITGKVNHQNYTGNNRNRPTGLRSPGTLTGLIGKEGAVGAFISNSTGGSSYAGGFVARPASGEDNRHINRICTNNPFGYLCYLEKDIQAVIINECIEGSNARTTRCRRAVEFKPCISNPFASNCEDDFADYYETARTKRINFCINNPTNSFCRGSGGISAICNYAPFASICFNGNSYKYRRANKINFCHTNTTDLSCTGVTDNPNAVAWEYHLANRDDDPIILTDAPDTANQRNQFLKGTRNGLNKGGIVVSEDSSASASLNMYNAKFNGAARLGGDYADGVASFLDITNQPEVYFYAGIFSGTDLGAPVTDLSGTASWVGRFQAVGNGLDTEFVLEIDFDGTGEKAGFIKAFVPFQFAGRVNHYYLDGYYDDHGLITGTIDRGYFKNHDRDSSARPPNGTLTGLIGKEGAVGAFIGNDTSFSGYAGGFVARPPKNVQTNYVANTCTEDPFHHFCHVEYEDQRNARIRHCITNYNNFNTTCTGAVAHNPCIANPFTSNCADDFADHYVTARTNIINFCTNNPTNSFCNNTTSAICTYAPFASICFGGGGNDYKSAREGKIGFCHANTTDLSCTGVTDNPNAVAWEYRLANRDDDPIILTDAPDTANRRHQFLKDLEDKSAGNLDNGDTVGDIRVSGSGSLNLNTATFNGRALGGDAADGVAFFYGKVNGQGTYYHYSGIFSGTDLGAPVTDTSGTASWVGRFQTSAWNTNREFVLEVDFNGTGDKAGYIKAFVQTSNGTHHFYLDGSYDAHGLITGTAVIGDFTNNNREDTTGYRVPGTLTGLIGKDGAVGAFINNDTGTFIAYSGGFVARPANTADKVYLNRICTDDPFGYLCYLEKDKQRDKIIECTEGSNASGAGCTRAVQLNPCINNPFASNCEDDFTDHYVTARTNRINFCVGNLTNSLCTGTGATAAICTYAPFAEICFNGDTYKSARASKINFCHTNTSDLSCTGVTDNPNAVALKDSFTTALSSAPSTTNRRNQFLKDLEDKSAGNIDNGDRVGDIVVSGSGSLNLNTATFNGRALGGDAADGVAFFRGRVNGSGTYYYYSGIFSGTDLGAPVTDTTGTASWVGRFQSLYHNVNKDFILEVDYANRSVDAFVQWSSTYHLYLNGNYDDKGIITGDFNLSRFNNQNRKSKISTYRTGAITGLIGQEGAVGAFHGDASYSFAGGFVARPANTADKVYLNRICTDDPFGYLCYLEKDKQRDKIIECTEGSNASGADCTRAVQLNPCINNPFASNCEDDFTDHYETARTNRINFCINNPTNSFCTNSSAILAICTYAPFVSICFNGDTYKPTRAGKIGFCHTNTSDLSCTGVTDNPNAVALKDSFTTALSSAPSTTNRRNQFLKGTTSGVNRGDIVVPSGSSYQGALNLNTATFNGRALGGDAADGVAFFRGRVNGSGTYYYYSGIFSGTDLGAPVTDTTGTASWVGRFQSLYHNVNKDFILEVDYANRSVDAFVQWSSTYHLYLNGNYDDKGIITGDFNLSRFNNQNRKSKISTYRTGAITGLIGQEGAVGAFHGDASYSFAGGFVARPANTADKVHLDRICTEDPFGYLCYLEKGKQRTKIIECIQGSNASGASCARAAQLNPCITNPFASNCVTDFTDHYVTARTNRINFCVGNLTNSLCTGTDAISAICTYAPFLSICFNGTTYKPTRAAKINFCHTNTTHASCTGVRDNPNAVAWVNSFTTALSGAPSTTNRRNQFLKGTTRGINSGDIAVPALSWTYKNLNMSTATFRGTTPLGGDASDGVAAIAGRVNNTGTWYFHAGIFSGTDLGAPVTQRSGKASWVGRLQATNYNTNKAFVLEVNFSDRTVDAFVKSGVGEQSFHIDGRYNSKGIITGTVNFRPFLYNDRSNPIGTNNTGTLAGLIGTEGAVGAFISNQTGNYGYSGGFVARPASNSEKTFLTTICREPDHEFCYLTVANRFLPGTRRGLATGGVTVGTPRLVTALTLGDNLKSGVPLGGSSNHGVSFFNGQVGSKELYFAGILSGTDLGRVFTSGNVAMEWNGRIKAIGNAIDKDFKLNITFNSGGGSSHIGDIEAFVQRAGSQHYHIEGTFTNRGVITGTVKLRNFSGGSKGTPTNTGYSGKLRGLIGEHGAIGAFIAKNNGNNGYYSGGFVASPNAIRYAGYSYSNNLPVQISYKQRLNGIIHAPTVLKDRPAGTRLNLVHLKLGANHSPNNPSYATSYTTSRSTILYLRNSNKAGGGVYFFSGSPCSYSTGLHNGVGGGGFTVGPTQPPRYYPPTCPGNLNQQRHFAGIGSVTNMGPVLTQGGTANATWRGRIEALLGYAPLAGSIQADLPINVNFNARTISGQVHFTYIVAGGGTLFLNGNYDEYGRISGTIRAGIVRGDLVGVIGQHGAVGAFVSNNSDHHSRDFSGGFAACPPNTEGQCNITPIR